MWDSVPCGGPRLSLCLHFLICIGSQATATSGEAGLGVTGVSPEMIGPPGSGGWGTSSLPDSTNASNASQSLNPIPDGSQMSTLTSVLGAALSLHLYSF